MDIIDAQVHTWEHVTKPMIFNGLLQISCRMLAYGTDPDLLTSCGRDWIVAAAVPETTTGIRPCSTIS